MRPTLCVLLAAVLACGKDDKAPAQQATPPAGGAATAAENLPPLPAKPLGVDSPRALGYVWGKGRKAFDSAVAAAKGDAADWKTVSERCRDALELDPTHLGAHHLLGVALGQLGDSEAAVDHLSTALAGNWLAFGPTLANDPRVADLLATPHGKALLALTEIYRKTFREQASRGILVVARRIAFRAGKPAAGKQRAPTRAELYAYVPETARYLPLTSTAESLIGFVASPSRDRIATLVASSYAVAADGVSFESATVTVLDGETFEVVGKPARLRKPARELMLFYGAGDELHLQTEQPSALYSIDVDAGKLTASTGSQTVEFDTLYETGEFGREQPMLYATFEMARVVKPSGGAVSRPAGDAAVSRFTVDATRQTIAVPADGGSSIRRISMSPDGAHVTFAGIGDACKGATASALYLADTRTGKLKHIHRGGGLHGARWIDNEHFVYEAEPGELRIHDVTAGKTSGEIKNRAGIALDTISNVVVGEHCPKAPTGNVPEGALEEGDEFMEEPAGQLPDAGPEGAEE